MISFLGFSWIHLWVCQVIWFVSMLDFYLSTMIMCKNAWRGMGKKWPNWLITEVTLVLLMRRWVMLLIFVFSVSGIAWKTYMTRRIWDNSSAKSVMLIDLCLLNCVKECIGPYHGGVWKVRVKLYDGYPYESPSVRYINKMYLPNVNKMRVIYL